MARAEVVHSDDACTLVFKGDKRKPEPSTGIIRFPGGFVEVCRTSDGTYWVHAHRDGSAKIVGSRVDYNYDGQKILGVGVPDLPQEAHVMGLSLRIDGPFVQLGD